MDNHFHFVKSSLQKNTKQSIIKGLFLFFLVTCSSYVFGALVITNGLTHQFDVKPGDTIRGAINVSNTSEHSESFIVYQRDYFINHSGESDYPEASSTNRSNAGWIDYEPDSYTLAPGESNTINYRIKVPDSLELNGTHWSVLLVEGTKSPMDVNQGLLTVNSVIRYAIQIICHFTGNGTKDVEFINVALRQENESKLLDVDIINSGDFMLSPILSVELFNEDGKSLGIYKSIRKRVYPKTSRRFEIDLTNLQTGSYESLLLADCTEEDVFGTNLTLEIKDE